MQELDPFSAGIYVAAIFSTLCLFILVFYPAVAGAIWQLFLGRLWPQYAQSKYPTRYSFMMKNRKGLMLRLEIFPAPWDKFILAVAIGFLFGFLFSHSRDVAAALLSFGIVLWFCFRMVIISVLPKHFIRVDVLFKCGRELAFVLALFYALKSASLLA